MRFHWCFHEVAFGEPRAVAATVWCCVPHEGWEVLAARTSFGEIYRIIFEHTYTFEGVHIFLPITVVTTG